MTALPSSPSAPRRPSLLRGRFQNAIRQSGAAPEALPLLVFSVGGEPCACSIDSVVKLQRLSDAEVFWITDAKAPGWVGVMTDRRGPVPVVSLRLLWGMDAEDSAIPLQRRTLLVFMKNGERCALLVDSCDGVVKDVPPATEHFRLPAALSRGRALGCETVARWRGGLILTAEPSRIVNNELFQTLSELMKTQYRDHLLEARCQDLAEREMKLEAAPTVSGYLELAGQYEALGLGKDAARLIHAAEAMESKESEAGQAMKPLDNNILSSVVNSAMLGEILQMLSHGSRTGDLVIDAEDNTFHIFLDSGEVVNASGPSFMVGLPAFHAVFKLKTGRCRFVERDVKQVHRCIQQSIEHLLLEIYQLADESTLSPA